MKTELNTLLIPTDFSAKSKNALKLGAKMAQRHRAKIILVHLVNPYYVIDHGGKQMLGSSAFQQNLKTAEKKLATLQQKTAEDFNIEVESHISTQNMVDTVNEFVISDNVDVVLMGMSGRLGIKDFVLGSTSYQVLQHAACSVLLVPENFHKTSFKKILLPVRVPHELHQKADLSLLLAEKNEADINLLGVGNKKNSETMRRFYQLIQKNLTQKAISFEAEFHDGDSAELIAKAAADGAADIILLADADEFAWKSFMAENFFKKMINSTDIPLLFVKSKLKKIKKRSERISGYDLTLPVPG